MDNFRRSNPDKKAYSKTDISTPFNFKCIYKYNAPQQQEGDSEFDKFLIRAGVTNSLRKNKRFIEHLKKFFDEYGGVENVLSMDSDYRRSQMFNVPIKNNNSVANNTNNNEKSVEQQIAHPSVKPRAPEVIRSAPPPPKLPPRGHSSVQTPSPEDEEGMYIECIGDACDSPKEPPRKELPFTNELNKLLGTRLKIKDEKNLMSPPVPSKVKPESTTKFSCENQDIQEHIKPPPSPMRERKREFNDFKNKQQLLPGPKKKAAPLPQMVDPPENKNSNIFDNPPRLPPRIPQPETSPYSVSNVLVKQFNHFPDEPVVEPPPLPKRAPVYSDSESSDEEQIPQRSPMKPARNLPESLMPKDMAAILKTKIEERYRTMRGNDVEDDSFDESDDEWVE